MLMNNCNMRQNHKPRSFILNHKLCRSKCHICKLTNIHPYSNLSHKLLMSSISHLRPLILCHHQRNAEQTASHPFTRIFIPTSNSFTAHNPGQESIKYVPLANIHQIAKVLLKWTMSTAKHLHARIKFNITLYSTRQRWNLSICAHLSLATFSINSAKAKRNFSPDTDERPRHKSIVRRVVEHILWPSARFVRISKDAFGGAFFAF